jgi:YVTN family beta-propeller protein
LAFGVEESPPTRGEPDRSPVDLVLTADEQWLLTANQTSDSVSLVRTDTGEVVAEAPCGRRPSALALCPDGRRVLVTGTYSGDLTVLEIDGLMLKAVGSVDLGFEPRGVAVSPDGRLAYVALTTASALAIVDLERLAEVSRIEVGRWPRYLALSPDGSRLAVGTSGDRGVSVVDTGSRRMIYQEKFSGIDIGQMQVSADGQYVYVPWMVYRHNPITPGNIRLGWVLASRIARVRLDGPARREAIALDPRGQAVSDPHGLALSPDEHWLVSAASGTQELLVYRLPDLPFQDYGGPGDHIDPGLLNDADRFYRVPLGGRPMAVRFAKDGKRVFVANYLSNAVQVVDLETRSVVQTLDLGGSVEPTLARRGEAIFYDGRRSLDQWYSCHSCHYEGHTNAVPMDTRNDGSNRSFKTVLSLRNVTRTGPWTWHGWQEDFEAGLYKSLTETMLGPEPTGDDVEALAAFLDTLRNPPNPNRNPDGTLADAAARGEAVFQSEKAGCTRCHNGPYLTDGLVHDVGLSEPADAYQGFNTPSLLGVYDRAAYLHDGRAETLEQVLSGPHNPARVTGRGELTDSELHELISYLKSL